MLINTASIVLKPFQRLLASGRAGLRIFVIRRKIELEVLFDIGLIFLMGTLESPALEDIRPVVF